MNGLNLNGYPRKFSLVWMLLLTLVATGCRMRSIEATADRLIPNFDSPTAHTAVSNWPNSVKRILILPPYRSDLTQSDLLWMQDILVSSFVRAQRAEIVSVDPDSLHRLTDSHNWNPSLTLSSEAIQKLINHFHPDAILFTDISIYDPYVPMQLGLRTKLITVEDQTILWAVDGMWNANRPSTMRGIRKFENREQVILDDPGQFNSRQYSPSLFFAYATDQLILTLPSLP